MAESCAPSWTGRASGATWAIGASEVLCTSRVASRGMDWSLSLRPVTWLPSDPEQLAGCYVLAWRDSSTLGFGTARFNPLVVGARHLVQVLIGLLLTAADTSGGASIRPVELASMYGWWVPTDNDRLALTLIQVLMQDGSRRSGFQGPPSAAVRYSLRTRAVQRRWMSRVRAFRAPRLAALNQRLLLAARSGFLVGVRIQWRAAAEARSVRSISARLSAKHPL